MNEHKHERESEMKLSASDYKAQALVDKVEHIRHVKEDLPVTPLESDTKRIADALEALVSIWKSEIARTMR